jgi:hypothetical protein
MTSKIVRKEKLQSTGSTTRRAASFPTILTHAADLCARGRVTDEDDRRQHRAVTMRFDFSDRHVDDDFW